MENNKVFKFLWRANAVFLFVAGIGLIALLIMFAALLISDFGGSDTPPPPITASTDAGQEKEVFQLRAPSGNYDRTLSSDDFVYFQLRAGTGEWSKLGSGSSSQLRNIAVFDLNENTTYWVFPNAGQEIENYASIKKTEKVDGQDVTTFQTGFVLTVAKSLGDGSVARDLWAMTPDGKTLRKILPNISDSPNIESYGENRVKLVFEAKTHIDIYPFDVDMLTVGKPTRVSMP